MAVNLISKGFVLLVGQNRQIKDTTVGSEKLLIFAVFFNIFTDSINQSKKLTAE